MANSQLQVLMESELAGSGSSLVLVPGGLTGWISWKSHAEKLSPRTLPQWPAWMQHRQSLRTQDSAFRHEEDIARVRKFNKPTLLFKGEGSSDFLHQIIDILGEEFSNIQVEKLPGGHAPHIVSAEQFMKIFTEFLAKSNIK